MWPFKFHKLPYTNPNRLADVMALIQVLALHKYGDRSDKGLRDEMQGPPHSGSTWKEIAQQHPEFFRVNEAERLGVSLVARHVLPKDENGKRELSPDFISILLRNAIDLHDRQIERAHHWKAYMNTVIPGALVILAALLGGYFTQKWIFDREIRIRDHEKRQTVFSELMGLKKMRIQLMSLQCNARIAIFYHDHRLKKTGGGQGSPDFNLAHEWMQTNNRLILDVARTEQKLFELLGFVKILFPKSAELDQKINTIYSSKYSEVKPPKDEMDLRKLEEWKNQQYKITDELTKQAYGDPLDDLLSYLSKQLK
jgi:hypothetical protein